MADYKSSHDASETSRFCTKYLRRRHERNCAVKRLVRQGHRRSMLRVLAILGGALLGATAMNQFVSNSQEKDVVTLGGGCFWCTEAVFEQLKGVEKVESGYSGGAVANPTYEQVCSGETGHAEVSQITFDPKVISLKELLEVFFTVHDPTTLNRQGPDSGTQYRSVIFFRNEEQKTVAQQVIKKIEAAKIWNGRIVTELVPFKTFYKAEDYHQEYFRLHGQQPYCRVVVAPKVAKFREHFRDKLKDN
jgi:peptide-methionine (S)-S-oxide reductase